MSRQKKEPPAGQAGADRRAARDQHPSVVAFNALLGPELADLRARKSSLTTEERKRLRMIEELERATRSVDRDSISSGRIYSRVYRTGYAENRNGFARYRFSGHSYAPGLRWMDENEAELRQGLEEWLEEIHRDRRGEGVSDGAPPRIMLSAALGRYLKHMEEMARHPVHRARYKPSMVRSITSAILYFFSGVDFPLEERELAKRVRAVLNQPPPRTVVLKDKTVVSHPPVKISTLKTYLARLKRVGEWLVEENLLRTNALDLVKLRQEYHRASIEEARKRGVVSFKEDVVEATIASMADHDEEASMYAELVWLTGMRASEALYLWWYPPDQARSHIKFDFDGVTFSPSSIEIYGKGSKWRSFPILQDTSMLPPASEVRIWAERLRALICRLWDLAKQPDTPHLKLQRNEVGRRHRVFRWSSAKQLRMLWNAEKKRHGEVRPRAAFHVVRATTRGTFENDLLYRPDIIADLLGHSIEVSEKFYRVRPTASMVARRILGGQLADNAFTWIERNPDESATNPEEGEG